MSSSEEATVCKFKEGDIVVRKVWNRRYDKDFKWSKPFAVHLIQYDPWNYEPRYLVDVFLNRFDIADCELRDIAESPLFQALHEV